MNATFSWLHALRTLWPRRSTAAELGSGHRTAARTGDDRIYRTLLRNTSDGLHILDASGRLIDASHTFFWMLGYRRDELIGLPSSTWWPDDGGPPQAGLNETDDMPLTAGVLEATFRRKDGSCLCVELTAYAIDINGEARISLSARDITERKQVTARMHQLAFYDALTGLANRRLLEDRLRNALQLARRHQRMMAILYLDLDKFKQINDELGHDVGDELLRVVAKRLTDCVRASDTVARLGGDEFVILLPEIASADDVTQVADKIICSISTPVPLDRYTTPITTSTSIGLCVHAGAEGDDPDGLMKRADNAMYEAKRAGRSNYRLARSIPAAAAEIPQLRQMAFSNSLQP